MTDDGLVLPSGGSGADDDDDDDDEGRPAGAASPRPHGARSLPLSVLEHAKMEELPQWARQSWLLWPTSPFRLGWTLVALVLLAWTIVSVPLRVAFRDRADVSHEHLPGLFWFEVAVDLFFLADVGVRLASANTDGVSVHFDAREGARRYALSWLLVDLAGAFPARLIDARVGPALNALRLLRLRDFALRPRGLQWQRLARAVGLGRAAWQLQRHARAHPAALRLAKLGVTYLLVVHL
jgi:hypothetical protein